MPFAAGKHSPADNGITSNYVLSSSAEWLCLFPGKRACVGESLARMELFIFLVSLLQHFTFSCAEGPDSINLVPAYSSFANLPRRYQIIATAR